MANALTAPPPVPNPQPQEQGSAPTQQPPAQAPAPSHAQTVAAMRHFDAILGQLTSLLKNPDLGKADLKSTIIDGVTKLVGDRIIPASQAVSQLATVPTRPFEQKQWAEQNYTQTLQAQSAVLDHHRSAALGTGNYALENKLHSGDSGPDNHMQTMQGLMQQHYGAKAA